MTALRGGAVDTRLEIRCGEAPHHQARVPLDGRHPEAVAYRRPCPHCVPVIVDDPGKQWRIVPCDEPYLRGSFRVRRRT